ncbi:MAG TPA: ATP-dependent Clp protease proteolytic subunit [Methyloceanibacter sp.]|nr:ATP-dependent Clp protease proteolytic subunit [Methyloceanibacter sp.]
MNGAQQYPANRVLTFYGPINLPFTNGLRAALCSLVNEGAKKVTLLFSSGGGSADDAIALYSYLSALPFELTMHAIGPVSSVAVPVFLVGKERFASQNARFYFHDYTWTFGAQTVARPSLAEAALNLGNALDWTRDILKQKTKLTDAQLQTMKLFEEPHLMDPASAAEMGLISAVREPTIPADCQPRIVA